ncbi:UNVERIFIED_CONTAM: hypothetical protein Sangu_1582400 [Sesamum angustifolium]|uniref:Uncharacterized protein n=1 Tax=Sesamum angustifolium TaxID=2727405 RepID=A0AAW2MRJ6_9LAMI
MKRMMKRIMKEMRLSPEEEENESGRKGKTVKKKGKEVLRSPVDLDSSNLKTPGINQLRRELFVPPSMIIYTSSLIASS